MSLVLNHDWDRHKWVSVHTYTDHDGDRDDGSVVDEWLWRRTTHGLQPSDFPVRLEVHRWERDVLVEGHQLPLIFIGEDSDWFARGSLEDRRVEIHACGFPSSELELVEVDLREYAKRDDE